MGGPAREIVVARILLVGLARASCEAASARESGHARASEMCMSVVVRNFAFLSGGCTRDGPPAADWRACSGWSIGCRNEPSAERLVLLAGTSALAGVGFLRCKFSTTT